MAKRYRFTTFGHFTVDAGGSFVLDSRGDEIGLFGHYYTTQVGNDKGTNGGFATDQIAGIGAFASYWIVPMKIGLMGRVTQNFAVENRFGGTAIQVGLNFLIPSTALMVKNHISNTYIRK
jgi:hypothetical protein